jgi:DNA-directed RNA polymerases I, II, and III subunit RPABC4
MWRHRGPSLPPIKSSIDVELQLPLTKKLCNYKFSPRNTLDYQPLTTRHLQIHHNMSSQTPAYGGGASSSNAATNPFNLAAQAGVEDTSRPVQYACGDCDNKVVLKRGDPIRCKECGHRVLYKERTNRYVALPGFPTTEDANTSA